MVDFKHDYKDRGWHNFDENLNQPRHCWYHFKEGFSNQLVTEAINKNSAGKKGPITVVDPFGGSGTTSLTAALLGHDSISIEVNPFCAFTSKVKCLPGIWNSERFRGAAASVTKAAKAYRGVSLLEKQSSFSESNGNEKWLFNKSVLRAFQGAWQAINRMDNSYAMPLKLAAIRSAMNSCNAKKDGKCLRYYDDWNTRNYCQDDFHENFTSSIARMVNDVKIAPIQAIRKSKVIVGDVRSQFGKVADKSCDLLVTSPPYLNSFDYSDIYRPELFLGQFVGSNDDLRKIRLKTVRSHLQVNWGGEVAVNNVMIKASVNALNAKSGFWNKRIPTMVEAYFYDMRCVLKEAARVLKTGSEAWIVVSTSAYKGVHIPVDLILADLGCEWGFTLKEIYVLRALRVAGQQQSEFKQPGLPLRESLIVLKR